MSTNLKGLERIQKKLNDLRKIEKNTKPLMLTIGEMLRNEIEDSFENERDPHGNAWKPLSSNTIFNEVKGGQKGSMIKSGKRHTKGFIKKYGAGGSRKILRKEGYLADRWRVWASNTEVSVSNNIESKGFKYGLTHQFGAKNAGRSHNVDIPARPFLPIKDNSILPKTTNEIENAVYDYIYDKFIK